MKLTPEVERGEGERERESERESERDQGCCKNATEFPFFDFCVFFKILVFVDLDRKEL